MELKYLEKRKYFSWDELVSSSPQGSVFVNSYYLEALKFDYKILCVVERDMLLAGIVLIKNQIKVYSNPMFAKYLGVLYKEEATSKKIISKHYKISALISKEVKKYKTFDYYFHPSFNNWIPFYWSGYTQQTRYTYIINLKNNIINIEKAYHGNLKNDIKNAKKEGVKIKIDINHIEFYEIINKTFKRQGSNAPFSKGWLLEFIKTVGKKGNFVSFGAYNTDDNLIAVCGLVFDAKSSYLVLNGIDIDLNVRGANAYMIDESIKYFHARCDYFDFEGSMLPGVEPFYRRFGGELTPYMRIWNDNLLNYLKYKMKILYKKIKYGR